MKAAGGEFFVVVLLMWSTEHSQNKNFSWRELPGRWKDPGMIPVPGD